jgi:hypothetical protein
VTQTGFGTAPPVTEAVKPRKQNGILKKQGSNHSWDKDGSNSRDDCGDDSPPKDSLGNSPRSRHPNRPRADSQARSGNSSVDKLFDDSEDNYDTSPLEEGRARLDSLAEIPSLSRYLPDTHSVHTLQCSDKNAVSNRRPSLKPYDVHEGSSSANRRGRISFHQTAGGGFGPAGETNSSLVDVEDKDEGSGRLSTPTLSFIAEAVKRNVVERVSPTKEQALRDQTTLALNEISSSRAATVLALRDSFHSIRASDPERFEKDQHRLRDLSAIAGGISGDHVGPPTRPYSPLSSWLNRDSEGPAGPGSNPNVARGAKKKRDFGPEALKYSVLLGRGFEFSAGNLLAERMGDLGTQGNTAYTFTIADAPSTLLSSARSLDSLGSDRSLCLGEHENDNLNTARTSAHPYARLPDQLDSVMSGSSTGARIIHTDVNGEFLQDGQSDALIQAYAAVLNLPSSHQLIRAATGTLSAPPSHGRNPTRGLAEVSIDLSQSSMSQLDTTVPLMDPLAPPTPLKTADRELQQDSQQGFRVLLSVGSSLSTASRSLEDHSVVDGATDVGVSKVSAEPIVIAPVSANSSPVKEPQRLSRQSSRTGVRSLIKASPLTCGGVMTAAEVRYLSMVDFLRARTAETDAVAGLEGTADGEVDIIHGVTTSDAISSGRGIVLPPSPVSLIDRTPASTNYGTDFAMVNFGGNVLSYLEDEEAEADLEREMRELLKSHTHSSVSSRGGGSAQVSHSVDHKLDKPLSQSRSTNAVVQKSVYVGGSQYLRPPAEEGSAVVKFPKITVSSSVPRLTGTKRLDSMLLKEDICQFTVDHDSLKKPPRKGSKNAPGMSAVVSQFGEGLVGTMSFKPKIHQSNLKLKSALGADRGRKGASTGGKEIKYVEGAEINEDEASVMSNLSGPRTGNITKDGSSASNTGLAKLDQSGNLVISLSKPTFDGLDEAFGFSLERSEDADINLDSLLLSNADEESEQDELLSHASGRSRLSGTSRRSSHSTVDKLPAIVKPKK